MTEGNKENGSAFIAAMTSGIASALTMFAISQLGLAELTGIFRFLCFFGLTFAFYPISSRFCTWLYS